MSIVYDSSAEDAFSHALQEVLVRHLGDNQKAITIWMEIRDLPELNALLSPPDKGQTE